MSLAALDAIRSCRRVYLEAYTSILMSSDPDAPLEAARLEALYGRPVVVADREHVEGRSDDILEGAESDEGSVAFLVVGDVYGATTHSDLELRARARGVPVRVHHAASVLNAAGCCGLQLYRFGETVSLCLPER